MGSLLPVKDAVELHRQLADRIGSVDRWDAEAVAEVLTRGVDVDSGWVVIRASGVDDEVDVDAVLWFWDKDRYPGRRDVSLDRQTQDLVRAALATASSALRQEWQEEAKQDPSWDFLVVHGDRRRAWVFWDDECSVARVHWALGWN